MKAQTLIMYLFVDSPQPLQILPHSSRSRHPSLRQHYVSTSFLMALFSKTPIYFIQLPARKCYAKYQIHSNSPSESLTTSCLPIEPHHIVSWTRVRHGLPRRHLHAITWYWREGHFTGHRISP